MGIPVARIELVNALQMRAMIDLFEARLSRDARACSSSSTAARPALPSRPTTFGEIAEEFGGGPFLWTSVAEERDEAVEGPARRLLGVADAAARRQGPVDRCLRADLAACRMHRRDRGRHRRDGADRADRRPCRRRQFPCAGADGRRRSQGDRGGGEVRRAAQHARHRHGRHLHRRARHRPGQDRLPRHELGDAVDFMRDIKRALDPHDILNPGKILSHPRR